MNKFFLNHIIRGDNNKESIVEVLKARGFLIDNYNGEFYLSNNAAMDDLQYLCHGLRNYKIGTVNSKEEYIKKKRRNWDQDTLSRSYEYNAICPHKIQIIIDECATVQSAVEFFNSIGQNGYEAGPSEISWAQFATEEFGPKASVQWLEAYIAFYVKAVSACGVYTYYSSDGNHKNGGRVYVLANYPSSIWHYYLWKYIVQPVFGPVPFIGKEGIPFDDKSQEDVYQLVYEIASYLYSNRIAIRNIRNHSVERLTKKYRRSHTKEEIELFYYNEECQRIFTIEQNKTLTNIGYSI